MDTNPSPIPRRRGLRPAFTLIETATAMMIISVAVVAMCGLLTAGTTANISGNELTTAVNLAGTIHEIAVGLPVVDDGREVIGPPRCIWDLNGQTHSPPIDGGRLPISDYGDWSQQVTVQTVDNKDVGKALPSDRGAPTARLTVTISHQGRLIHTQSWVMTADDPL